MAYKRDGVDIDTKLRFFFTHRIVQKDEREERRGVAVPEAEDGRLSDYEPHDMVEGTDSETECEEESSQKGGGSHDQVAGNIHKEKFRDFWKTELEADEYVLNILEQGYKLPFKEGCKPEKYREKNNKSAVLRMGFATQETERWVAKKVVREVFKEPLCVSPLTVAVRKLGDGEEKLRLCLDLSRYINTLLRKEAVKLAGIDKCLQNLLPGDFIATYDLTSAFHHVKIHEEHQQYLAFSLPGEQGQPDRYFVFEVMPFGLASAVSCITRLTKPLCQYIASKGIRHSIYIDDGNVLAQTLLLLLEHLQTVLEALKAAGFVISPQKTDTADTVSQIKLYLGFVIDSVEMKVRVSEDKIADIRQCLNDILDQAAGVKAKCLAKGIGKLVAVEQALGPVVQLLSRMAQHELATATEDIGWNCKLRLAEETVDSLRTMERELENFNGFPIKNLATAKTMDVFIEHSKESSGKQAPAQLLGESGSLTTIAGDASAVATCALEIGKEKKFHTQYVLREDEQKYSSGQRELLTVLRALESERSYFQGLKNQTLIWLTDSTNLVSFLMKGTMKMPIQRQVMRVYRLLTSYQIRIVPIHLKRSDYRIQWADEGSRYFDPDDWTVDRATFEQLTDTWRPTVDLFAHTSNAKCMKFYTYGNASNSAGVDAFAQDWTGELAWTCPPIYLIPDAIKKIESTRMQAIFIVPEWRTSSFWAMLFPDGKHALESCKHIRIIKPHIIRGEYCQNRLLQGYTKFAFIALYIVSEGKGYKHKSGTISSKTNDDTR